VAELEAEVDVARSEARSFGSMAASKERDAHRRLEGLQDELEHANEQVGAGSAGSCLPTPLRKLLSAEFFMPTLPLVAMAQHRASQ
jgi:hypothetical protein